ncbi:hypothetical protein D9M68_711080 [compost metagenome]
MHDVSIRPILFFHVYRHVIITVVEGKIRKEFRVEHHVPAKGTRSITPAEIVLGTAFCISIFKVDIKLIPAEVATQVNAVTIIDLVVNLCIHIIKVIARRTFSECFRYRLRQHISIGSAAGKQERDLVLYNRSFDRNPGR